MSPESKLAEASRWLRNFSPCRSWESFVLHFPSCKIQ